ncbi:hypothetical protein ACFWF7_43490 [Nocardia sp. NPDC060256]|uniref:hypothetical protein n=1 Tax=unclassified Nocardia TaxID=2637762 RepID=UPI00365BD241
MKKPVALLFAVAMTTVGVAVALPASASAAPRAGCLVDGDWSGVTGHPPHLNLHGENSCPPGVRTAIGAHVFANGVLVGQPGSGGPNLDWFHLCNGTAPTDWRAEWNDGVHVTTGRFNCG